MDLKIAIPNSNFSNRLISNIDNVKDKYNISLSRLNEEKCLDLLIANRIHAAILSPLSYGSVLGKTDLRIIPGPAFSAKGFSGLASVFFKENLTNLNKIATSFKNDFLVQMGLLLLKERFDIDAELIEVKELVANTLNKYEAIISIGKLKNLFSAMDVTDEWFDVYELPLPIAFWVCRAEEHPENILEIIYDLISKENKSDEHIHEHNDEKEYFERDGTILWEWSSEVEAGFEQCLQLLYYHQVFSDIPALKILGKDIIENNNFKIKIDACEI